MAETPKNSKPKAARSKSAAAKAAPKGPSKGGAKANGAAKAEPAPQDRMVDAALALAAERPWHEISLREIAEASGLPLAEAYRCAASKQAILEAFLRRTDALVLSEGAVEEEEGSARDRVFDILMRRFDALQPHRKALASILLAQTRDPAGALAGLAALQRSMTWMLEAAGLEADGLRGLARTKGLTLLYLATLRTWLRDDSLDLARTMAALDGYLRRLEGLLRRLPRRNIGDPKTAE
ncbi:MAG: helix-turn-helix domain-containing protein [Kiloniellales bacterium]|nr:helix-turn-helix domain-containing protein [Kiloniellales bacterium]